MKECLVVKTLARELLEIFDMLWCLVVSEFEDDVAKFGCNNRDFIAILGLLKCWLFKGWWGWRVIAIFEGTLTEQSVCCVI